MTCPLFKNRVLKPIPASSSDRTLFLQRWEELTFLHWRYPASLIRQTLPPGLDVDLLDGDSWMSVVIFRMRNLRFHPFPYFCWKPFWELNLRTYVTDGKGNRGIWFYSLDANDRLAVIGAKTLYVLPYRNRRISTYASGDMSCFDCMSSPDHATSRIWRSSLPDLQTSARDSLSSFLLERYRFWSVPQDSGKLISAKVRHPSYDASTLSGCGYSGHLFRDQGFCEPSRIPDLAHYCQEVEVEASGPCS